MKTILVPVDFSEACDNALNYAVQFAKQANLQISLLNVYDYPVLSSEPVVWVPSANELIGEHLKRLESIRDKIHLRYGKQLNVHCYCEPGTVIDTINTFVREHHTDLIIMGMQGGGFVSEKIIGSTTTSLMRKAACPVLGIAKEVKFRPISQIVLATDYKDAPYMEFLKPLKELIRLFNAHLYVLYVIEPTIMPSKEIVVGSAVGKALEAIPYTAHTLVHVDFAAAIDQFIDDKAVDMAVIIPKTHSFFYTLFHEATTKKLAFHADVPLLALHE